MRFSIIVPIYNREKSILKTIQSITEQSFRDFEILLVNDGSDDESEAVCMECARVDERLVYIYQEHRGVSAARNCGIINAQGEYILFIDADDGLEPDALDYLNNTISEYPNADIFAFGFVGSDFFKTGTTEYISKSEITEKYLPAQLYIDTSYEEYFIEHYVWNKCYRSDFIKNNNILFDENHYTWEDGLFTIDCLAVARDMVILPDVLYRQNIYNSDEHLSYGFYKNQLENYINDAELYKHRFGNLYNFATEYHCSHNVRMVGILISRAVKKYGKKSVEVIDRAVKKTLLHTWVDNFTPRSKYEKRLKYFIKRKSSVNIYRLYRNGFLRKIYNKLKNLLN